MFTKKIQNNPKQKDISKIAIVGNRGVGKSSIAKVLSFFANFSYISTDVFIRYENNGETIQNIIQKYGWKSFRDMETKVLQKSIQLDNIILDCGGGIIAKVDSSSNQESFCSYKADLLSNSCYVVYIHASVSWLLSNQKTDENRPKYLTNLQDTIENREKWYYQIANYVVDRATIDTTLAALDIYQNIKAKFYQ